VNPDGIVDIAPFDPQSVEMFYVMARRSGQAAHFYPMALDTYDILPPPDTIQIELGEARRIRRAGIHLVVGTEINMASLADDVVGDKRARRAARARAIWSMVVELALERRRSVEQHGPPGQPETA
jgi:glycerol-3-phosphate O-acyltransferase